MMLRKMIDYIEQHSHVTRSDLPPMVLAVIEIAAVVLLAVLHG